MEILKTTRLLLRTWTRKDLPFAMQIWGDPNVMKYVELSGPLNESQIIRSLEAGIKHQEKNGFQHWAVVDNTSQNIIGACGFNRTEASTEIELVFHFIKDSWGRGLATEAAKACVDHAVKNIRHSKIIAGCHPENEASKRVLLKSGFSFKGHKWFEDTQREEPFFELDSVAYSKSELK